MLRVTGPKFLRVGDACFAPILLAACLAICSSTLLGLAEFADVRADEHPLDPALKIANEGRDRIRREIKDYSATLIKRERIDDTLHDYEFMSIKVRNRKLDDKKLTVPFAVYLKFQKPKAIEGREVIWVEGKNNGKLVAHEGGYKNVLTVRLDPRGTIAMIGQRYPITEIGVENLVNRLIEKGERDRKRDECEVQFYPQAKVGDRPCTLIEVRHPHRRAHFDFSLAQVFIDQELGIPIRYAAYQWPESAGKEPLLEEEYTYQDIKLNVGLTERDFDPDNSQYKFK